MADSLTQSTQKFSGRHFGSLDGLRGLAFLSVLCFHYLVTWHVETQGRMALENTFAAGWIGVELFFALSGFLMTGILLDTRDGAHDYRNFIARRARSIVALIYGVAAPAVLVRTADLGRLARWSRAPLAVAWAAVGVVAWVGGQLNIHERWTALCVRTMLGLTTGVSVPGFEFYEKAWLRVKRRFSCEVLADSQACTSARLMPA